MATTSVTIIALVTLLLLFESAIARRTNLFPSAPTPTLSASDGVCVSMVQKQGYPCEEHKVTTKDGYILSLQRIPNGRSKQASKNKIPVLLQHGLGMDAVTWLILPPGQSLAYLLADNGYDVWLSSSRGTKYSLGHVSLSPDDSAYWNWTWDELATFDLPATVQYVHDKTGKKLHYVGHSLGTLIILAPLSKSELVDKISSAALLCPIAYLGNITSPFVSNAASEFMVEMLYWLGVDKLDPKGKAMDYLLKKLCTMSGVDCTDLLSSYTGKNCCLNPSVVDVFLDHEPQAAATKNLIHLAQMIRTGTIRKYDYNNEKKNKEHYGQGVPPTYNMENIPKNFPILLGYGGADAVSVARNVKILIDTLKDHQTEKLVPLYQENYAHADYVMGFNAKEVVYNPLMDFFKKNV